MRQSAALVSYKPASADQTGGGGGGVPINRLRCQGAELHSTICLSNYALITTVYANTLNICIEHSAQLSSFSLGVLQEEVGGLVGGEGGINSCRAY